MSSPFYNNFPTWLLQPTSFANVFSNQFASLKEVSTYVNVPNYPTFSSGFKKALFWRRRLAPSASSRTVILSLLGQQGLILPNILEVCQALKSVCNMHNMVEFYRATNSSFIGISFNNTQEADKIRSHFSYFQDAIVIHVSPASSLTHHFKLLWLPPLFSDSRIHHFLSKHSTHHTFSRDHVLTDTNVLTPSNSVSGTFTLSPTYDFSKLPHLIPLPPPHLGSALLIVSGRASLCLKCGSTGHVRRSCTSSRCSICHQYHLANLPCNSTSETFASNTFNSCLDVDIDLNPASHNISSMPDTSTTSPVSLAISCTSTLQPTTSHSSGAFTTGNLTSSPPLIASSSCCSQSSLQSVTNNIYFALPDEMEDKPIESSTTPSFSTPASASLLVPAINSETLLTEDINTNNISLPNASVSTGDHTSISTSHTASTMTDPPHSFTSSTKTTSTSSAIKNVTFIDDTSLVFSLDTSPSISSFVPTSHSKKRPHNNSHDSSDILHTDSSISSPMNWAQQVEESFPITSDHLAIASDTVSPSSSHSSSSSCSTNLDQFSYNPAAKQSKCEIICPKCANKYLLNWPITRIYLCDACNTNLSISSGSYYIPNPSAPPIFLSITKKQHSLPEFKTYLSYVLSQKVNFDTSLSFKQSYGKQEK